MDLITKKQLNDLMAHKEDGCVSIYMPTHRKGQETKQDRIRFKNCFGEAREKLEAAGSKPMDAEKLLAPARRFFDDDNFWLYQSDTLALFLAPGAFRSWRLPLTAKQGVYVGQRFHIKPLIPVAGGDMRFYVLGLAQNRIRLFQADRFTIDELNIGDTPKSLAEALRYDDPEKSIQWHTGTERFQGNQRAAMFHGQGFAEDEKNKRLLRYFNKVDNGLRELLHNDHAPLVLAGVEYLHPLYRESNSYPYLQDKGVYGNPEFADLKKLHQEALAVVEPVFDRERRAEQEKFRQLAGEKKEQALDELKPILSAAHSGRIATLFVAAGLHQWGAIGNAYSDIDLHEQQAPGDEDLLDHAAVETLATGGKVFTVSPEELPGKGFAAAVLRY